MAVARVFPSAPVSSSRAWVSSVFGQREAFRDRAHPGIDFAVPEGTPVYAVDAGHVERARWDDGGGGWYVFLRHGDGLRTAYLHLSSLLVTRSVQEGQQVRAGEVIALSGNSGESTGPHLHFEVRIPRSPGDERLDPAPFLPERFALKPTLARLLGVTHLGGRKGAAVGTAALALLLVALYLRGKR